MTGSLSTTKHIVVISTWSPPMIGGPVLFYNLFSQLLPSKYHIITDSRAMTTGIDPSTWLPGHYIFADRPMATKEDIQSAVEIKKKTAPVSRPSRISATLQSIENLPILREALRLAGLMKAVYRYQSAFSRIPRTEPILLLGLTDNGPALIATYLIAKKYHLPYMYYFFDLYRGNNFSWMDKVIARLTERILLVNARELIVNNEGTAKFLQSRYGEKVNPRVIYNSVFPEKYERHQAKRLIGPPYKIIFTGNISWPQEESVVNLLRAGDDLKDLPLQIVLYTNRPSKKIVAEAARHDNVLITYAPYAQMPAIQNQASLLFLPLAWHTKGPDIIATATPGKFTDYLASGRPILIHAPEYAYISIYGKKNNLGIVVDQEDVHQLATEIRSFIEHPEREEVYVTNALRIFHQNHDARKNAKKLVDLFNSA